VGLGFGLEHANLGENQGCTIIALAFSYGKLVPLLGKLSYTQNAATIWTHGSEADAGAKGWYKSSWVAVA